MRFFALIEVTPKETVIMVDDVNMLDTSGVDLIQKIMLDFASALPIKPASITLTEQAALNARLDGYLNWTPPKESK